MRYLALALMGLFVFATPGAAQDSDRGFIQGLLEDALSDDSRSVRIEGFAGALSREARIDQIVISDPDGAWLTLDGVVMTWNRSALLNRRIEIEKIAVDRLELPRLPLPTEKAPTPEASAPFQLPELPVALRLDALSVAEVVLGAPILGEAVTLSVSGSARLEGGAGAADLAVQRLDKGGSLTLAGEFDNATRDMVLALDASEPDDGLAVTLLNVPDTPPARLVIDGTGTPENFTAQVQLTTEEVDRLSGQLTLRESDEGLRFVADLGGDLAPVLAPDLRPFLGDAITLQAEGLRDTAGGFALDQLALETAAMVLRGEAEIGADGWPQRLDLSGRIADPEGAPVRLPLPGEPLHLIDLTLQAGFDAAQGDEWQLEAKGTGIDATGMQIDDLTLSGAGRIARDDNQVTGRLQVAGSGLTPDDPALAEAIGPTLAGGLAFDWRTNGPLQITELDLAGADYGLTGSVTLAGLTPDDSGTITLTVDPDLALRAQRLDRFAQISGLAGLGGAAALDIAGRLEPLTGGFGLTLAGKVEGLTTGIEQADPLLDGTVTLDVAASRDNAGLRLTRLDLVGDQIRASATGLLSPTDNQLQIAADLAELGGLVPQFPGPANLSGDVSSTGGDWTIDTDLTISGGTTLAVKGTVAPDGKSGDLDLTGRLADLGKFVPQFPGPATLTATAQSSGGDWTIDTEAQSADGTTLTAKGTVAPDGKSGDLDLTGRLADLGKFVPQFPGPATLTASAQSSGGDWTIDTEAQTADGTTLTAKGTVAPDGKSGDLDLTGRLADLGKFVPQFPGPATLTASAQSSGGDWTIDTEAETNDGTTLALAGTVAPDASRADLTLNGRLANLGLFVPELPGPATVRATVRNAGADWEIDTEATGPDGSTLTVAGTVAADATSGDLQLSARMTDLGRLIPDLPGPSTITGQARSTGGDWSITLQAAAPGGTTLRVSGDVAPDASRADLSLSGAAPLALANRRLAPQSLSGTARLNLRLNGPLAVSSISGDIVTQGARLTLPTVGIALEAIDADVRLASGRAQVTAAAAVSSGGRLQVAGPIALAAPFDTDLRVTLTEVGLSDPTLYETSTSGEITLTGALAGTPTIGGVLTLGQVNLRIPELSSSAAPLDGLRHIAPPESVVQTLRRAGVALDDSVKESAASGEGSAMLMDLTINAPRRIYVRGRGLDAELGGSLRLLGSTRAIVPQGQFTLIRGRMDLLGNRLQLTEGTVSLRGSFDPVLRFAASTTTVDGTEASLVLSGIASAPEISVTSVPELPQDQVLALLLFGRPLSGLSAFQAVQLANAVRTLAGKGGEGFTGKLRDGLGVDDVDLTTDENGEAQARVGKYLSEDLYTDVRIGSGGDTQINLNYDLSPNITLRGRVGPQDENGIGLFFERDY